ncbi:ATP-binding cassette domain-containing protein [Streptomyces sp. ID03-2B]|uniref:ABC transporter ATP-binding protein n=2 Tax=Streptomyces TaxID=1883 RepID=UPI0029AA1B81|nr:ATP-binding cassette domain-containing protein [Streptomyces sp. ID03-2B]MDX3591620.1 ATP-binding cassette domain-containing protein [Streptomyces sp. ID03-2B]
MAQHAQDAQDAQDAQRQQVISVRDLRKEFKGTTAVDGVSFDVRPGRVTGFLGPNGAGKTTTLRMILGLIRPTGGSALLWGSPYAELAAPTRRIGVGLDGGAFVGRRTGRGHLRCYAPAAGCGPERVGQLLADVGLSGAADRPVAGYSTGMKQRLSLASALLGDPELLVLDEPANGLDPEGMLWLREFLRDFAASGRTVLLSSHLLGELEQTVDDVLLMHHGRLLSSGPLDGLLEPGERLESAFLRLTRAGNGVRA